jgi:acyl dehydratase
MMKIEDVQSQIGQEFGPTDWITFEQDSVNAYGAASGEDHWIHTDPERAKASGLGGTIVPAFQMMSRIGKLQRQVWSPPEGVKSTMHYGFDKIRIPASLKVGEPVRARFTLVAAEAKRADMLLATFDVVLERRNADRPAVTARWLVAYQY